MKKPDRLTAALLEHAVDTLLKIYWIRGECSSTAQKLLKRKPQDVRAVEDCARLDEALSRAYLSLQSTVSQLQRQPRRKRRRA